MNINFGTTSARVAIAVGLLAASPVWSQPANGQKTSQDQKNNKDDASLTVQIRKNIIADKSLSTAAHNIVVVSENGAVTLRGQVEKSEEKATLLQIARSIAGPSSVADQITVATPKE